MDIEQIQTIVKRRKEKNISRRALAEKEFDEFAENINNIEDKSLLAGIDLPKNLSLQSVMPSLYEDVIDIEEYKIEYSKLKIIYDKIDEIANRLKEEAEAVIASYES